MNAQKPDPLERLSKTARQAGETVARVTTDACDTLGAGVKILELKAEISRLMTQLGKMAYATHKGTAVPEADLEKKLSDLDALHAKLEACRKRVSGDNPPAVCCQCKAKYERGDCFCRKCGQPL